MNVRHHRARHCAKDGISKIKWINTNDMSADALAEAAPRWKFAELKRDCAKE